MVVVVEANENWTRPLCKANGERAAPLGFGRRRREAQVVRRSSCPLVAGELAAKCAPANLNYSPECLAKRRLEDFGALRHRRATDKSGADYQLAAGSWTRGRFGCRERTRRSISVTNKRATA